MDTIVNEAIYKYHKQNILRLLSEHNHKDFRNLPGCRMGNDNILSQLIDGGLQGNGSDINQRAHKAHG